MTSRGRDDRAFYLGVTSTDEDGCSSFNQMDGRTLACVHGMGYPGCDRRQRYRVTLSSVTEFPGPVHFTASVFAGRKKTVDLEDAFAWGGFDIVKIERHRGRFGAREAGRILREVVADLCYESLPLLLLDAGPGHVAARVDAELDDPTPAGTLTPHVLRILAPKFDDTVRALRRRRHPDYLEVIVEAGDGDHLFAVPRTDLAWRGPSEILLGASPKTGAQGTPPAAAASPVDQIPRLAAGTVVARYDWFEEGLLARHGKRLLLLHELIDDMHQARIREIEASWPE